MILTVDIGNSNIVYCGYINDKLCFTARASTDHKKESDQYAVEINGILALKGYSKAKIKGIVVSSVVPGISPVLFRALRLFCDERPFLFEPSRHVNGVYAGIKIAIDNPGELGSDLLAAAVSVKKSRPLPAVIIDMGTATKISALDKDGVFRGVAISPGLFLSMNALFGGTSLQKSSLEAPVKAIGTNTADSIQSGIVYANASMLDGMIDRFEAELGEIKSIVATGGACRYVIPNCKREIEICDSLVLDGLYAAYMEYRDSKK